MKCLLRPAILLLFYRQLSSMVEDKLTLPPLISHSHVLSPWQRGSCDRALCRLSNPFDKIASTVYSTPLTAAQRRGFVSRIGSTQRQPGHISVSSSLDIFFIYFFSTGFYDDVLEFGRVLSSWFEMSWSTVPYWASDRDIFCPLCPNQARFMLDLFGFRKYPRKYVIAFAASFNPRQFLKHNGTFLSVLKKYWCSTPNPG